MSDALELAKEVLAAPAGRFAPQVMHSNSLTLAQEVIRLSEETASDTSALTDYASRVATLTTKLEDLVLKLAFRAAENERLREALEQAGQDLCSEYCTMKHHTVHLRVMAALASPAPSDESEGR